MQFERLRKSYKKQIIIGAIAICVIGGALTFSLTRAKYEIANDLELAKGTINYKAYDFKIMAMYKSDDKTNYTEIEEMPSEGYTINESKSYCNMSNGNKDTTAILKTIDGNHSISKLKKNDKCYLYFDKKILKASEELIASNQLINEKGYRYEGTNPNNYILFNDELWRIIGVFSAQKSSTNEIENMIKIIREESLGTIPYDNSTTNGTNNWNESTLQKILNVGDYYNRIGIFNNTGLKDTSKNIIETVIWNLGGYSSVLNINSIYESERGEMVYLGNPTIWSGKVGLMYVSDYGYASDANMCPRETIDFKVTNCINNNWLYKDSYSQWTITPNSSVNFSIMAIYNTGSISGTTASSTTHPNYISFDVRPAVYLKSNIIFSSGDGTIDNPYVVE